MPHKKMIINNPYDMVDPNGSTISTCTLRDTIDIECFNNDNKVTLSIEKNFNIDRNYDINRWRNRDLECISIDFDKDTIPKLAEYFKEISKKLKEVYKS